MISYADYFRGMNGAPTPAMPQYNAPQSNRLTQGSLGFAPRNYAYPAQYGAPPEQTFSGFSGQYAAPAAQRPGNAGRRPFTGYAIGPKQHGMWSYGMGYLPTTPPPQTAPPVEYNWGNPYSY